MTLEIFVFHRSHPDAPNVNGVAVVIAQNRIEAMQELSGSTSLARYKEQVWDSIEQYDAAYAEGRTKQAGWFIITSKPIDAGLVVVRGWE